MQLLHKIPYRASVCVCVCEREREMIMASQGAIGLNIFKIANFHLKQPII